MSCSLAAWRTAGTRRPVRRFEFEDATHQRHLARPSALQLAGSPSRVPRAMPRRFAGGAASTITPQNRPSNARRSAPSPRRRLRLQAEAARRRQLPPNEQACSIAGRFRRRGVRPGVRPLPLRARTRRPPRRAQPPVSVRVETPIRASLRFSRPRSEVEQDAPAESMHALRRPAHALPTPVSKVRDSIDLVWLPRLAAAVDGVRLPAALHRSHPKPVAEPVLTPQGADAAETLAPIAREASGTGGRRRRPNHRAPSGRRATARVGRPAPAAAAAAVEALPSVDVPTVEGPSVELAPAEVLPVAVSPVEAPPLEIPPVEVVPTPVAPPVEVVPVAPPIEVPPVEVAPMAVAEPVVAPTPSRPMPAPNYPKPKSLAEVAHFAPFVDLPPATKPTPPAPPTTPPAPAPTPAPPTTPAPAPTVVASETPKPEPRAAKPAPETPAPVEAPQPRVTRASRRAAREPNPWLQRLALAGLGLIVLAIAVFLVVIAFRANGGTGSPVASSSATASGSPSSPTNQAPTSGQSDAAQWVEANLAKESAITAEPAVAKLLTDAGFSNVRTTTDYSKRGIGSYLIVSNAGRTASANDPTLAAALSGSAPLARFGDGADPTDVRSVLNLSAAAIDARRSADRSQRISAGQELVTNPRIVASTSVGSQLAAGVLDIRAATVLAQLAAESPVTLVSIDPVPAETLAGMPARQVTISTTKTSNLIATVRALPADLQPTQFIANATGGQLSWPVLFAPQV
ncbi:hypothetical protein SAMN05444157_0849 [Frankineae bacterium MT45]|nr:hypothetical protein SAMN05444157_0849 [Frankineae bacterium MT45]